METLSLNVGEAKEIRIKTVSEMIEEKKIKLLGHCIRAENDDPMRQPFLRQDSTMYKNTFTRRVGHPRNKWHEEVFAFS